MCELLEIAKERTGLSYYGIAKKLEISTPLMNKWKNNKSQPNGINSMKLANMAELTTSEALKIMEKGYSKISSLIIIATISSFGWILVSGKFSKWLSSYILENMPRSHIAQKIMTEISPIEAIGSFLNTLHCILCKINKRFKKAIKADLSVVTTLSSTYQH